MQRWLTALVGAFVFIPAIASADFNYGYTPYMPGSFAVVTNLDRSDDDGMFVLGNLFDGSEVKIFQARIKPDGTPDEKFGKEGVAEFKVSHGTFQSAQFVLHRPDGSFLIVGTAFSSDSDLFLLAADRNGNIDKTFGIDGQVILDIDFGSNDQLFGARLGTGGKILLFGNTTRGDKVHYFVSRLNSDGSLDPSFGDAGYFIAQQAESLGTIEFSKSGLAYFLTQHNNENRMTRFLTDGNLDKTFGKDGVLTLPMAVMPPSNGFKFDSQDRIVMVGNLVIDGDTDVVATRLLPDGTVDPSFGSQGTYSFDSGMGWNDFAQGFAIDTSDRITFAFSMQPPGSPPKNSAIRLLQNGSADSSFGDEGMIRTMPKQLIDDNLALGFQSDGRMIQYPRFGIRKGSFGTDASVTVMVARFKEDGTFDEN